MNEKESLLKMKLQYFAEDGEGNSGGESDGNSEGGEGTTSGENGVPEEGSKSFSQAEVDRRISKAVESAMGKQKIAFESEKQKEIDLAKKEAEEYSKLTEREKTDKDLSKREQELEEREQKIRVGQLQNDVEKDLKERGLPTDFSEVLILVNDSEKIKEKVNALETIFNERINEVVKEKLEQGIPKDTTHIRTNKAKTSLRDKARENRLIKN